MYLLDKIIYKLLCQRSHKHEGVKDTKIQSVELIFHDEQNTSCKMVVTNHLLMCGW